MKKATLMLIAVVYVASIVVISVLGLKSVVYNRVVPVQKIECINEPDENVDVAYQDGKKLIKVKYIDTNTMIQLYWRVLPDDATNKEVRFVYDRNSSRVHFEKINGKENGLVFFSGKVVLNVRIMAADGSRVYTEVVLWAY